MTPPLGDSEKAEKRSANVEFIRNVTQKIPGWLNDFTAACLADLLDMQEEQNWTGSTLEIGVYGGRFCSILARDAARRGSHLVAIDPFIKFPLQTVRNTLAEAAQLANGPDDNSLVSGEGRIDLIEDFSSNWTPDRLLSTLGERARFIHIDGSHQRADVLWDLAISDGVLAPNGVIALDDWLNPQCLGVMEATFQFFQNPPRACVPFGFVTGKLLLCGRTYANEYRKRLEAFATEDATFDQSDRFRKRSKMPGNWLRQTVFGFPILVIV